MNNKLFFDLEETLVSTTINNEVESDLLISYGKKMRAYTNIRPGAVEAIERSIRSVGFFDVHLITESYKDYVSELCRLGKLSFYQRNIISDVKRVMDLGDDVNESNNYLVSSRDFDPSDRKCRLLGIKDEDSYLKVKPYLSGDDDSCFLESVVNQISKINSDRYDY